MKISKLVVAVVLVVLTFSTQAFAMHLGMAKKQSPAESICVLTKQRDIKVSMNANPGVHEYYKQQNDIAIANIDSTIAYFSSLDPNGEYKCNIGDSPEIKYSACNLGWVCL